MSHECEQPSSSVKVRTIILPALEDQDQGGYTLAIQARAFLSWVRRFLPTRYTLRMNCLLFVRAQCSLPRQLGPSLGSVAIICSAKFHVFYCVESTHVNIELSCDSMKVI